MADMTNMQFMTLDAYKEAVGVVGQIEVKYNDETGKYFGVHNKGTVKVQQNLDRTKDIRYMYEEGNFPDGCIINVKPLETKFSL